MWSTVLKSRNGLKVSLLRFSRYVTVCGMCVYAFRRLEWKNFDVVVSTSKMINVRNVHNDAKEKLDFRDRVIKTSLGFKHLIVATSSQCNVYRFVRSPHDYV